MLPAMQPALPLKLPPLIAIAFQHRDCWMRFRGECGAQFAKVVCGLTRFGQRRTASFAVPKKWTDLRFERLLQRRAARHFSDNLCLQYAALHAANLPDSADCYVARTGRTFFCRLA